MRSSVEIFDIATGETRVVWQTERLVEAPNWSPDGKFLIINGDGRLYRLGFDGSDPTEIDTALPGTATTITESRPTAARS